MSTREIRIESKRVELFSGSTDSSVSGVSIPLNDSISNYDYLEVIGVRTSDGLYGTVAQVPIDFLTENKTLNIGATVLSEYSIYLRYNTDKSVYVVNMSTDAPMRVLKIYGVKL